MNAKSIWKSKKAQINDISIIAGIVSVFVILGAMMPYIQQDFDPTESSTNVTTGYLEHSGYEEAQSSSSISMWTVFKSVLLMFVWTFGQLPLAIDLIFVVFRILLVLIVARNVWIGGGG